MNLERIYVIAENDAGTGTAAATAPDPAASYLLTVRGPNLAAISPRTP